MDPDKYKTIPKQAGPVEIKEKGSRFIAWLFHVETTEQADEKVAQLWKKYHNATHICYGWRLGRGVEEKIRFNDDGEPSGTAGPPILNEIKKQELFNVLVCVARYFGGVKLGTGGLLRAYRAAAEAVLQSVQPVIILPREKIKFSISYKQIGAVMQVINSTENIIMSEPVYSQNEAEYTVEVPVKIVNEFKKNMTGATSGEAEFLSGAKMELENE